MKILSLLCLLLVSCNCAALKPVPPAPVKAWTIPTIEIPEDTPPIPTIVPPFKILGKIPVAHISLSGRVQTAMADVAEAAFAQVARQPEIKGILLELNSEGGEMPAGFRITKAIERINVPVVCLIDGTAQSMAYYILQSCDVRLMTKRSYLMIHQATLDAGVPNSGTSDDWENVARDLVAVNKGMMEHIARRMNMTPEALRAKIPGTVTWCLNWEEAMKVGAVDGIAVNHRSILSAMRAGAPLPLLK